MDTPQYLFALDIGTRSVVGLIGEKTDQDIRIIAYERQEHHTRAMLDGQIHDVLEVAKVIRSVKSRLESQVGPLKKVSVAAAGRALCTIKSAAEMDARSCGILAAQDETSLELTAIQNAQHQLATSNSVPNPTDYFCVGYSVVTFTLDDLILKSLVGQRGKNAGIEVIATFLPRQVIDSMESAIQSVDLEIATLTLEPIAAIHVLIPPTMRHLNLALVDVGAGTSDVALTESGSVVAYGMVPYAGDEITEAISQKYLLDFNVAEQVKRQLGDKSEQVSFVNVLGLTQTTPVSEIITSIAPAVGNLAQAIAKEILTLNSAPPQAVLLVGGGSMTPDLPVALAQSLNIDTARVAIRRPETIEGIPNIPPELQTPDAVTPLGILKLSASRHLSFITVTLNKLPLKLFNLGRLSVANALLAGGIDIKELQGRPGLGLTLTLNGATTFVPGSYGHPGSLTVNGQQVTCDDEIHDQDQLLVEKGINGLSPSPQIQELLSIPEALTVTINKQLHFVKPLITVNGQSALPETTLTDRAEIVCRCPQTLGEVLALLDYKDAKSEYSYLVNGSRRTFLVEKRYKVNKHQAELTTPITELAEIEIQLPTLPKLYQVIGITSDCNEYIPVTFNKSLCNVPVRSWQIRVNGEIKRPEDEAPDGCQIDYVCSQSQPMINSVMLAANFAPLKLAGATKIEILLNGQPAELTSPVKNRDQVDIIITMNDNLSEA